MAVTDMDEGAAEGWGEDAALVIDEGNFKFDYNYIHISCMLLGGNLFFVKSDLLNLAINFDCSSDCKVLIFF